jgi:nitroreductase
VNETIRKQLDHRTIREFTEDPIPKEIVDQLFQVARRTASSTGMQASSIIRVNDPEKKKAIAKVCRQEYVARAPELWIFIVDLYRNSRIAKEKNCFAESIRDMDRFFSGFTDACIMTQNVVNAAESMDLGTNYLGSILNDPMEICKILNLPKLTFPVVGLGIGYPNQKPQIKPKMDMKFRVFEDEYKPLKNYLEAFKDYDQEMHTYYDLRDANRRVDCFTDQVVKGLVNVIPKRQEILNFVIEQGFDLGLYKEEE